MRLKEVNHTICSECGGPAFSDLILAEKKDACYYKVKASAKVWPSAYASGRLVQCRKKGADNYGKSKNEGVAEAKSLKKHVRVVQGEHAGKTGWIREIKHGAFKGAPKRYYVDIDGGGQANNLPAEALRLIKDEQGVAEADKHYSNTKNPVDFPKTWHDVDKKLGKAVDKMSQAEKVKKGLAHPDTLKKKGVAEEFGPLPKDNQQIRLGRHTVDIERVGKDKNYIGFAWHDSKGQEHYEEVAVGDLGSYDDLIKRIKDEIRFQERQYTEQGVAEEWSEKYKRSINCSSPRGFSQRAHCAGRKKNEEVNMNPEYDDEAGMADNNLETLRRAVDGLDNLIQAGDNLPEWCQEKIANAKSMLVAVWDYMESEQESEDPEAVAMFEAMDQLAEEMARRNRVTKDLVWEQFEALPDNVLYETAAWRRAAGKSKTGGLNRKGVASYRRENPGSKLQMAVTTKPSKLKPGSKAAKRRKSFCARMSGVKGPMKKPNGKPTRKALALRKWNC